jgi:ubiquitin-conjugating enzyme E2 Q
VPLCLQERSDGNVFNMVIEIPRESFDQDIPLVKDMVEKKVSSILMEIRYGDSCVSSLPPSSP